MLHDIRLELHFYGRTPNRQGVIYLKAPHIPMECPEVLFFCLFTLKLLVNRRVSTDGVARIQRKLSVGADCRKVFELTEDRPFEPMMELTDYSMLPTRAIRSQIIFRGADRFTFVLGCSGFTFLHKKSRFEHCAEAAVFGHMETVYRLYRDHFHESLEVLWKAASALSRVDFSAGTAKNCKELAYTIYLDCI